MNQFRALWLNVLRVNPVALIAVVIVLAGLAFVLNQQYTSEKEQKLAQMQQQLNEKKQVVMGTIVKAKQDIPEGTAITADMLTTEQMEADKIAPDNVTSPQAAQGQTSRTAIAAGTILRTSDFAMTVQSTTFEQKIKDGFRAVTFGIDTNSGVAGFIAPDSHVDIIASAGVGADTKASPILSNVEVIAVGQTYQKTAGSAGGANPASSITVAVSPEDADKLIKAIVAAKLYLTLRNVKDNSPLATVDVTSLFQKTDSNGGGGGNGGGGNGGGGDNLSQLPAPPPLPDGADSSGGAGDAGGDAGVAPPPLHEIEIWSGSSKNVLQVPQG